MSEIISGIYKITSPKGRIYIGQSIDIYRRFYHYRFFNCKTQRRLYNSIKKYGYDKHKFEIVHVCNWEELNELEIYYISLYQSFNSTHGLNLREGGGRGSGRMSDETKKLIGDSKRGKKRKPFSKQARLNMAKASSGRKHSEETKAKMSAWQKGIKKESPSKETRDKLSKANKGRKRSAAFILQNKPMLGKKHSEETKLKMRNAR